MTRVSLVQLVCPTVNGPDANEASSHSFKNVFSYVKIVKGALGVARLNLMSQFYVDSVLPSASNFGRVERGQRPRCFLVVHHPSSYINRQSEGAYPIDLCTSNVCV